MRKIGISAMLAATAVAIAACATTPGGTEDPLQSAMKAAKTSAISLDTAILGADAAVKQNLLKGQDAQNVVKGTGQAKAALDAVILGLQNSINSAAASASAPASGATR